MANTFTLVGYDKVKQDFIKWGSSVNPSMKGLLDFVERSALSLLLQNTPKDTGELSRSWTVIEKTRNSIEIGVRPDQEEKLQYVVNGTRYTEPNRFMDLVDGSINNLLNIGLADELVKRHRFWRPIIGKVNITNTVGLTGTKYNKRRSRGKATIYRLRKGRIANRVRIGRRRSTAGLSNQFFKDIKIG